MDDSGHRDNRRHKQDMYKAAQNQWLIQHQPSMKQIMSIMAERDAAIQERNMALNEKTKALEERDLAILERDTAIQQRNEAMLQRDNALATLQFRQSSNSGNCSENNSPASCPPGCQISRELKHMHHLHQLVPKQEQPHFDGGVHYDPREVLIPDPTPLSAVPAPNYGKQTPKTKRARDSLSGSANKRASTSKSSKKVKGGEGEQDWKGIQNEMGCDVATKPDWKGQDLGLNQVAFDDSTMPAPVCSCTGMYRQCYKWGNGGWQSACCTTTLSVYPLPAVPNKRHARIGGRKMSGSAFGKLLSRLAAEGHDLTHPVDLKEHWAKHGTNRYITIK